MLAFATESSRRSILANAAMLDDEDTYTLGPLIHNPKVVEELDANGVHVAASPDDARQEGIVIIRSHGVEPDALATLRERGLTDDRRDAPHVAKAQRSAAQLREHGRYRGGCGPRRPSRGARVVRPTAGERAVVVANANELP